MEIVTIQKFTSNFEIVEKQNLQKERDFFKNAEAGTQIFWKNPEECPLNEKFIAYQKRKYPEKLVIVDIFPVRHDQRRKLIIVSHNGEVIKSSYDGRRVIYSPLWFRLNQ